MNGYATSLEPDPPPTPPASLVGRSRRRAPEAIRPKRVRPPSPSLRSGTPPSEGRTGSVQCRLGVTLQLGQQLRFTPVVEERGFDPVGGDPDEILAGESQTSLRRQVVV